MPHQFSYVNLNAPLLQPSPVGTPPTFEAVYGTHFAYVERTLRRMGVPPAELDDVIQEAFLVVYRRLPDYDESRPLLPWLFGIAYRVACQHRRRRPSESWLPHQEPIDERPNAEANLAGAQARKLVLDALQALDLDQRAVVILHDIDEQAIPVVAETLNIPLNTAYSRLRAGRQRFAAAIRRQRNLQGDL